MHAALKILVGALAIGSMTIGHADAGLHGDWPLTIDWTNRAALGSPAQARAGAGSQLIGCWVSANGIEELAGGDATLSGGCAVADASASFASCTFPTIHADPTRFLLYLGSRDALLWFAWDASNTCTLLETAVFASMQPKVHG